MSAEQQHLPENALAAIDNLAVLAVQQTCYAGPEVDIGTFVANVTGLPLESVDDRIDQITANGHAALLVRDTRTDELRVNRTNDRANRLADAVAEETVVIGNQQLSMSGLLRLLQEHQRNQAAVNAAAAAQRRFGGDISFDPDREVQKRGFPTQELDYGGQQRTLGPHKKMPVIRTRK
jgi:hypothetical protein